MTNAERIQANSAELQECLNLVKNIVKPSGILTIDKNGIHDVTAFESVDVKVASGGAATGLYKFNDTIDENETFEHQNGTMFEIPEEEFRLGMEVKNVSFYMEGTGDNGDPIRFDAVVESAFLYPTNFDSTFDILFYGEIDGEVNIFPVYTRAYGSLFVAKNLTFEIVNYGKYETWFKANISPVNDGECDKPHVIEVTELPTENIDENAVYFCDGKYYKPEGSFSDVIIYYYEIVSYKAVMAEDGIEGGFYTIPTKTTEGILESNAETSAYFYYIVDENDIFLYIEGAWLSFSELVGTFTFGGHITDISDANTNGCYYAMGGGWKVFQNTFGTLSISAEGEYDVANKEKVIVTLPKKPTTYIVESVADLPTTNIIQTDMAIVLMGE